MKHMTWTMSTLALAAAPALAQLKVEKPNSDADNFKGDTVSFGTTVQVKAVRLGSDEAPAAGCVAAHTRLQGLGRISLPTSDGKGAEQFALFRVGDVPAKTPADPNCASSLAKGTSIAVSADVLSTAQSREGWSFGALSVPYKYQLRGDRSLAGGASLGGYLGRRTEALGLSQQVIVFAGVTKVDVPVTNDGKSETEQLMGLSYGLGSLWSVKNAFQIGLVVGWDRVARSASYANNGKPWISLSLGYDFFN